MLIDVLLSIYKGLMPFVVVDHYTRGIILRFGKYHRTLEPGFHWTWPLAEECLGDNVVTRTENADCLATAFYRRSRVLF